MSSLRLCLWGGTLTVLLAVGGICRELPPPWEVARLASQDPGETAFIALRRKEAQTAGRPFVLERKPVPLAAIAPKLVDLVVVGEDWSFYQHHGVDWKSMRKAMAVNLRERRTVLGGSTITMQLAKNLWLSPRRDPLTKVRQIVGAAMLEHHLSKDRILELYLNVIEWGPGIFGVEAASRHYFWKPASQLTLLEASRLASTIPSPLSQDPNSRDSHVLWRSNSLITRYLARKHAMARSEP